MEIPFYVSVVFVFTSILTVALLYRIAKSVSTKMLIGLV